MASPRKGRAARTKRTPEKDPLSGAKATFLQELARGRSITGSAEKAGLGRTTVYQWRDADPVFAEAWDDAIERGSDNLEDEMHRRAFDGVTKPLVSGGRHVADVTEYSDTLAIFLMKARRPDKYRENHKHQHEGNLAVSHSAEEDILGKLARLAGDAGSAEADPKPDA